MRPIPSGPRPPEPKPQRLRITFAKTEPMRFTSNLDVQTALERMFRRAQLPVLHTQGYNPRPKLHIAAALPLGVTGRAEVADVWLERPMDVHQVRRKLERAQPPGLRIRHVEEVPLDEPALQNRVRAAEYEVRFLEPVVDLAERVARLMAADHLHRPKPGKRGGTYDLRPLIEALEVRPQRVDEPAPRLWMRLRAEPGATGRPDEVLDALGLPWEIARVERTRLIWSEP